MTKRTYLMDDELLEQFEKLVPQGKRGAAINKAIAQMLEEERKAEIRRRMEEYFDDEEAMELCTRIDREWAPLSDEVWSAIDDDWSKMSEEEINREFQNR